MNTVYDNRFVTIISACFLALVSLGGCQESQKHDTPSENPEAIVERQYVVSDIIRSYDSPKTLSERVDEWIVCVTANIESGNWNTGKFSISADHDSESILAKCNKATHDRIHVLLEDIRKLNNRTKP